jgi:hypothetical protein
MYIYYINLDKNIHINTCLHILHVYIYIPERCESTILCTIFKLEFRIKSLPEVFIEASKSGNTSYIFIYMKFYYINMFE